MTTQSPWNDPAHLKDSQYKTDSNLAARQLIHERFSVNRQNWLHWLYENANLQTGQTILDAGCGNGAIWSANLADSQSLDARVFLLDLSRGMVQTASLAVAGKATNWLGVQASAMDVPLADGIADRVFANHMLYHVPNPAQAIAQFARVLKSDGKLVVALNGPRHFEEMWLLFEQLTGINPMRAAKLFSPQDAEPILRQHFQHVNTLPFDDALRVTDADLLWKYITSMAQPSGDDSLNLEEKFKAIVNDAIAANGYFYIQKDTSAIVCNF